MGKDDPLQQHYAKRTLWLDKVNMAEARNNFWHAYNQVNPTAIGNLDDRHTWDVAWAAAIAAFDYMQNGRVEPY